MTMDEAVAVVLFDDGVPVAPLTDLRPAADIRTGAFTTRERWRGTFPGVRAGFAEVESRGQVVIVNARCPLPPVGITSLAVGSAVIETATGHLVVARVESHRAPAVAGGDFAGLAVHAAPDTSLISKPWHVRTLRDRCIANDLERLMAERLPSAPPAGVVGIGDMGLRIARSATVYPSSVLDTEAGPIIIDEFAVIRPGAILMGPCYVGPHSTILERATIRPQTAIGPWCKVNGEVGGTIFQGYSNKAHDGYLGDSWVGEWVNLGAGTTNSNLLNTYGEVIARATAAGPNERTGEQFLGAVIGDHVKTAICTRIMTGSVLHTGGMFATTAPVSGTTPPFGWFTDAGTRSYRLDKFTDVARAAMARRKVTPDAAYLDRLRALHATCVRPAE